MAQNGSNKHGGRRVPAVGHGRAALLRGTALQAATALVFASHAVAQPAPTARPTGGQVVAGSANIAQTTAQTTVNQSTSRAAIDWQSFDVGSQHTVQFNQPSASAVTLNRVSGPDPSQIAGKIIANGNIIITNPSGVFFHGGAQVNASGLVVSAPGITNQNFMAGRMVFDQPAKPGAVVSNAGTITVKQAGLAALVAPGVVNSGTINARMGHVVLAGAESATLDLYGDGLVSIDVTKQVRTLPHGPDGKALTALVTNTGTVIAAGGTVQLTAQAVDGIVQNLVQAGGTIRANSVAGRTGRVEITGIGGSVRVEGRVAANGGAGQQGGTVAVNASDTVTIATGARVTANGRAGGGTVALGTTVARAQAGRLAALGNVASAGTPTGTARHVVVQTGAAVSADATGQGNGGTVSTLSTQSTQIDGLLSTAGSKGGVVEVSSDGLLALNQAPNAGKGGTLYLDPYDLIIGAGSPTTSLSGSPSDPSVPPDSASSGTSYISPSTLVAASQNGAITISLNANHDLTVEQPVNLAAGNASAGGGSATGGASLYLHAGHDLIVSANITLGDLDPNNNPPVLGLDAGHNVVIGPGVTLATSGTIKMTAVGSFTGDPAGASITVNDNATISTQAGLELEASNRMTIGNNVQMSAGPNYGFTQPGSETSYTGVLMQAGAGISIGNNTRLSTTGAVNGVQPAIILDTGGSLTVGSGSSLSGGDINGPSVLLSTGSPTESSLNSNAPAADPAGAINLGAASVTGASTITLSTGSSGLLLLGAGSLVQADGSGALDLAAGTAGILINGTIDGGPGGPMTLSSAGPITQSAGGVIVAADLVGSGSAISLLGTGNHITQIGASIYETLLATSGDVTVVDAIPLTVGGSSVIGGGIQVTTGHTITVVADALTIGPGWQNTSDQRSFQPFSLSAPGGTVAIQPLTAGHPVELVTGTSSSGTLSISLEQMSNVQADRLLLGSSSAGPVTVGSGDTLDLGPSGSYASIRELDLVSGGAITERAGTTLVVNTLTANGGTVDLGAGINQINYLGASSASTGDLALDNGTTPLTITGALTGSSVISLTADSLSFGANSSISTDTLQLIPFSAGRGIELVANSRSDARLSITQAMIDALNVQILALGGAGPGQGGIVIGNSGDTLDLKGHASYLALIGPGAITEGDGASLRVDTLAIPNLSGAANQTSSVTLGGPNQIARLFAETTGPVMLNNTGALQLDVVQSATAITVANAGNVSIQRDIAPDDGTSDGIRAPVVSIIANGGNITFDPNISNNVVRVSNTQTLPAADTGDNVVRVSGTLTLQTDGSITQNAGTVAAGTLVLQAGAANLGRPNAIGALGAFTVPGALALTTMGDLALSGSGNAGSLALNAGGAIAQTGGAVAAATLTGSAAGAARFDSVAIKTLAGFSVLPTTSPHADSVAMGPSAFSLTDAGPLTVTGELTAGTITISATDHLQLNDGTIRADNAIFALTSSQGTPTVAQTGTTTVAPLDGASSALAFVLPGRGAVTLQNLAAPMVRLTLELGSGTATGTIDVAALQIDGQGGSTALNGVIAGQHGAIAARLATIAPNPDPAYQLNSCLIGGVVCATTTPSPPLWATAANLIGAPLLSPDRFLQIDADTGADAGAGAGSGADTKGRSRKRFLLTAGLITIGIVRNAAEITLLLPNVSDRDF